MDEFFVLSAKYLFVLPVLVLGAYFFFAKRWPAQKGMALFAVPAALLALVLGKIANRLWYDPRPFVLGHFTPLVAHAADNGFPSDHTLLVSAIAVIGTYWDRRLGAALWVIAVLVAIARVYVGVHHLIDVLASMVIALVAVMAWHAIVARKRKVPPGPSGRIPSGA